MHNTGNRERMNNVLCIHGLKGLNGMVKIDVDETYISNELSK